MIELENDWIGLAAIDARVLEEIQQNAEPILVARSGFPALVALLAMVAVVGVETLGAFVVATLAALLKPVLAVARTMELRRRLQFFASDAALEHEQIKRQLFRHGGFLARRIAKGEPSLRAALLQSSDVVCQSCELIERRDRGEAPAWDNILRTDHWDVVHAFGTSLEGWLVLVVRRHVETITDLTDAEAEELGPLTKRVSQALQAATGCVKTYVAQFAEHPHHQHVHVHVIARYADQPDHLRGPRVFDLMGQDHSLDEGHMTAIAERVARHLLQR